MRLNEFKVGDQALINNICIKDSIMLKPLVLGLVEGTKVKILSKTKSGIELQMFSSKLAISNEVASRYSCMKLNK